MRINAGVVMACVALATGAGCKEQSNAPGKVRKTAPGVEVHEYTVRGEVSKLPSAMNEFMIRHEAIPEFRNPDGSLGMNTMTMEFPLGEGVTLGPEIAPGDVVEFTFVTEYGDSPRYYLTRIEELPADTALDFSPLSGSAEPE